MEEKDPFRLGLLKVECRLSDSHPVAGKDFTLTAYVQNSFDVPIDVLAVRLMVPSGLEFISKDRGIDRRCSDSEGESPSTPHTDKTAPVEILDGEVQLAPGDTLVHMFTIRSTHWFFATTEGREAQLIVSYLVDNISRRQAETIKFTTRTRIISPVLGSVTGGFLGCLCKIFIANQRKPDISLELGWQSIVSIIFAVVATLMAVRRLGTQPVFTVEDVYGGFVLGFLIGYLGRDFFESLIPAQNK